MIISALSSFAHYCDDNEEEKQLNIQDLEKELHKYLNTNYN